MTGIKNSETHGGVETNQLYISTLKGWYCRKISTVPSSSEFNCEGTQVVLGRDFEILLVENLFE
jgi:hypothetical protein